VNRGKKAATTVLQFFPAIYCSPFSVTRAMILDEMFLSTLVATQGKGITDTPAH